MHIHVASSVGEAKFWIEPDIALAVNHGLPPQELGELKNIIKAHEQDIRNAWQRHFGG